MPQAPSQRNEQTGSTTLDRIQAVLGDLIAAVRQIPFLWNGRLVSVRFVAATRKEVRHALGVPAACLVVRQNYDSASASVRLSESATRASNERQNLALVADANCVLDLWFYPQASKSIDANQGQSL
jgi:nitroreductase